MSATLQPAKKPKLASTVLSRPETLTVPSTSQDATKSWELAAVDIEAVDLLPTIEAAKEKDEHDKIVSCNFLIEIIFKKYSFAFCFRLLCFAVLSNF